MTRIPTDRYDGLPERWPDSVKETHAAIEAEHEGELSPEQSTSLYEACAMLATAEALDEQVARDGLMIIGSRGSQGIHPGIAEARAQRRNALEAIRGIALKFTAPSAASAAGASLAAQRWARR